MTKKKPRQKQEKKQETPMLVTQACGCGECDGKHLVFVMLNPQMKRSGIDGGRTVPCVYMPAESQLPFFRWVLSFWKEHNPDLLVEFLSDLMGDPDPMSRVQ